MYAVDHGNQRVIRIDITTGSNIGTTPLYTSNEPVVEYSAINGYTQETVITGLDKPSGIDVIDNRLIVAEHATGEIIIYDISAMPATELYRVSTGYTSVQGINIGPDGYIWFVDQSSNGVYKIDITSFTEVKEATVTFNVYPNPVRDGVIYVNTNQALNGIIELRNLQGQLVAAKAINNQQESIEIDAESGMYFISIIENDKVISSQKVILE